MTNYEKLKSMTLDEMAEKLCDNADCVVCPAMDAQYCKSYNLKDCSVAMKKYLMQEEIS